MADIFLTRSEYDRFVYEIRNLASDRDEITIYFDRDPVENTEEDHPEPGDPVQIRLRKQPNSAHGWEWIAVDDIYVDDEAITREI
jgi:hypothetical protein